LKDYPLTWMEYVHREGRAPMGMTPPGFRPCQHCGLPLVWQQIKDPLDPRWEWRTALLGEVHDCDELVQRLEDHDAEYAVMESSNG
jgi:hypothetical protein